MVGSLRPECLRVPRKDARLDQRRVGSRTRLQFNCHYTHLMAGTRNQDKRAGGQYWGVGDSGDHM